MDMVEEALEDRTTDELVNRLEDVPASPAEVEVGAPEVDVERPARLEDVLLRIFVFRVGNVNCGGFDVAVPDALDDEWDV